MVSNISVAIFVLSLIAIGAFFVWSVRSKKKRQLLNSLFMLLAIAYSGWVIPLIVLRFIPQTNETALYIIDCIMQPGGSFCAPFYLAIAVTFIKGDERLNKWVKLSFIPPIITVIVAWTNVWHHLYYTEFSVVRSEIVFGPYMLVSGAYNYVMLIAAIILLIRFGIKSKNALYWKQSILLIVSGFCPLAVSAFATFSGADVPITATPLSFCVLLLACGIAIVRLHVLDIRPIATEHVLNAISDGYLVLSDDELIIKYNRSFEEMIAKEYGLLENRHLRDCVSRDELEASQNSPIYNMIDALNTSKQGETTISYEQTIHVNINGKTEKKHFMVDVAPLEVNGLISGFVVLFKDVTQLRASMKKLQDSQERMMEQERFAFLGQMIGGLAHNLKTPIMSISGCISASDALVDECLESLSDPDVTEEDYREIYNEMREWFSKVKESTAYMSDIITAIKGQATNISADEQVTFTIDEMLKRSMLLMRHELLNSGCKLQIERDESEEIILRGDINNLVQVVGNLINNSIFAQKEMGGGTIRIEIDHDEANLRIRVLDRGTGISDQVIDKLFKVMVTSKGTMGSGLGLFISNAVIRNKFNGEMWAEQREGGGCIFGIAIPLEGVTIKKISGTGKDGTL